MQRYFKVTLTNCGVEEVLMALDNGDVFQFSHYCKQWNCTNPDCRSYKTQLYLDDPRSSKYQWYGYVPPDKWRAVRGQIDRLDTVYLTVTLLDTDRRLILSEKDVGGRSRALIHQPNSVILDHLKKVLTTGAIKQVRPKFDKPSRGMEFINRGDEEEQDQMLADMGFTPKDNPMFWKSPEGWSKEDTVKFLKANFDTVRLRVA